MTEEQWLSASDPLATCDFVREATTTWKTRWLGWRKAKRFAITPRQWRCLELACCERIALRMSFPRLPDLLKAARAHAEGALSGRELMTAVGYVTAWLGELHERIPDLGAADFEAARCTAIALGRLLAAEPPGDGNVLLLAARAVGAIAATAEPREGDRGFEETMRAELAYQVHFVHDVIGNPFRSERLEPAWLTGQGGLVKRLAAEIAEQRCYHEMPVLGDALEDVGCDNEAILSHCRSAKVHVRGCWVLELVSCDPPRIH